MTDSFLSIEKPSEGLYKEKGSKFIALAYPVHTEEEIRERLAGIKKEHYSARHWCYAWRLGADKKLFRANDDGEPSGTAGKPILNQLISADLSDVLIVVVRYFGGTLLGTGGLITAYRSAAADALQRANIITRFVTSTLQVSFDTQHTNEVMRRLKEFDAQILQHNFDQQNEIVFSMRLSHIEKLRSFIEQNNLPFRIKEN